MYYWMIKNAHPDRVEFPFTCLSNETRLVAVDEACRVIALRSRAYCFEELPLRGAPTLASRRIEPNQAWRVTHARVSPGRTQMLWPPRGSLPYKRCSRYRRRAGASNCPSQSRWALRLCCRIALMSMSLLGIVSYLRRVRFVVS